MAVNIEIMRAFVRLRRMLASHADLARKLDGLEKKYDAQFKVVFDAIRAVDGAASQTETCFGVSCASSAAFVTGRNRLPP